MATTYPYRGTSDTSVPAGPPSGKRRRRRVMPWMLLGLVLVACAAAALVGASTPAVAPGGDPAERAAAFIGAQLESSATPAASYAVVDDGQVAATGTVGDGIGQDTPFLIGSLSKSFTSLAIMQLVDRGRLGLDDPVTEHIPWFRTADPDAVITVRQLLDQSSGIPTAAGTADLNRPETSLRERVRALADVRLAGPPGETFRYSNKNYAVLGLIVERVSGQDYAGYVREHIFTPLEMRHSYTDQRAAERAGLASGSATWFGASVDRSTEPYPGALPDGYLISTAADLTNFLQVQLDGTYEGRRIVSERGVELMHTASVPAPSYGRDDYGFGWATGTVNGEPVSSHAGELASYYSNLAVLPKSGDGVVVLTARHALFEDKGAPMDGALEILSGGTTPEVGRGFLLTYVVVDALALALLGGLGYAAVRGVRRLRDLPRVIARAGWAKAVLVPGIAYLVAAALSYLAVFVSLGAAMDSGGIMPLATSFDYAPDITALVLVSIGFLAVRGVATLMAGGFARRRAQ